MSEKQIFEQIDGYKVVKRLARTQLSEVYEVLDSSGKRLCLKMILAGREDRNSELAHRFHNEAKLLAQVSHPSVVHIEKIGSHEGAYYMCMELIEGGSLLSLVSAKEPLALETFFDLAIQITEGLAHVHQKGVIHQDLKPDNILLARSGDRVIPKIADFGLAGDGQGSEGFVGTLAYVSPEQARVVDWPVDVRSDLYSLGVMFYQLLTGALPFGAKEGALLLSAHLSEPPIPMLGIRKEIPPLLERIISKLLAKRPEDRYQSSVGLLTDLQEAQARFVKQEQNSELTLDLASQREQKLHESFVGREAEMKLLASSLQSARSNHLNIVFVGGHAGVGKSALIREFSNRALVSGARFAYGKNYEFSRALPYFCLGEAFEDFRSKLLKAPEASRKEIHDRIQSKIGNYAPDLVQLTPGYAHLFPGKMEYKYLGEEKDRQRFHEMVHSFLDAVSLPMAPLLLLLDDLQWADNGLLSLLNTLITSEQKHSVLILCTYRSEEVQSGDSLDRLLQQAKQSKSAQVIELQPFTQTETGVLATHALGGHDGQSLPPELIDDLFIRTQGNAFFISEVLKIYLSGRALTSDKEGWVFRPEIAQELKIPSDVVALVLRRLDTFSNENRKLLGEAAWIGTGFSFEEVCSVHGSDPDSVYRDLKNSVQKKVLQENSNGTYLFCHDRIHEACKDLIAEADRPSVHHRIILHLESSSKSKDMVFQLAEHSIQAKDPARIAQYCRLAGQAARQRHSNLQALRYFEKARECIPAELEKELRKEMAEVLALLGKYDESIQHYQYLLEKSANDLERAQCLSLIAECLQRRGEYEPARLKLHESLRVLGMRLWSRWFWIPTLIDHLKIRLLPAFSRSGNEAWRSKQKVLADVLRKLWFVHIIQDIRPLTHISSRLLSVTTPLGASEELAVAMQLHAMSMSNRKRPEWKQAMAYALRSVEVGREVKANQVIAGSMVRLAAFSTWKGDHQAGLSYSDRAREMLTAIGNLWDLANAHIFGFMCRKAMGDLNEALGHASAMVELAKKTGSKGTLCSGQIKIGEVLHLKGKVDEGLEMINNAISVAVENKLNFDTFQGYKALGQCLLRSGRFREAAEKFQNAIDILEKNGGGFFYAYHSEAYLGWAEAMLKGREFEAHIARVESTLAKCEELEKYFKEQGWILKLRGILEFNQGRVEKAIQYFDQAIALLSSQNRPLDEALCRLDAGTLLASARAPVAIAHLKYALVLFKQMDAAQPAGECQHVLKSLGETVDEEAAQEKNSKIMLDALLEIGLASVQSLDPLVQARAILDKVIGLMNADRALLFLWDEVNQVPKFQIGRSRDGNDITNAEGYSSTIIKRAMSTGESVVVAGTEQGALIGSESAVVNNLLSMVATPILLQQKLIGALYLDHQMLKGVFSEKDTDILQAIAQHIGVAIQATRLSQLEVNTKELEKNMEVTRAVQSLLLPKTDTFRSDHIEMAAFYCSASQSGGDWWGYEDLGNERFVVMMGDVTGHGPGPAMITAAVAGCIGTFRQKQGKIESDSIGDLLKTLDGLLHGLCQNSYWMTFTILDVDIVNRRYTFWSSGSPPLFKLSPTGEASILHGGGSPLGANLSQFEKSEGPFEPGSKILVFSDGVHEMKAEGGASFGIKRTRKVFQELASHTAEQLRGQLWKQLEAWKGKEAALDDDVTFLVLEHLDKERKAA